MMKNCPIPKYLEKALSSPLLKVLSDPVRQKIVCVLLCERRLDANSISQFFTQERSVISRHLKILTEAQVLNSVKEGRHHFFTVNGAIVIGYLENLLSAIQVATKESSF